MEKRFYQFSLSPLPKGVARLAETVVKRGMRVGIYSDDAARLAEIDAALWEFAEFLPHSVDNDDGVSKVHLSSDSCPNGDVVFALDGCEVDADGKTMLCCLFAAQDTEIVKKRRGDWAGWKLAGDHITYWAESANGAWEKKAEENG